MASKASKETTAAPNDEKNHAEVKAAPEMKESGDVKDPEKNKEVEASENSPNEGESDQNNVERTKRALSTTSSSSGEDSGAESGEKTKNLKDERAKALKKRRKRLTKDNVNEKEEKPVVKQGKGEEKFEKPDESRKRKPPSESEDPGDASDVSDTKNVDHPKRLKQDKQEDLTDDDENDVEGVTLSEHEFTAERAANELPVLEDPEIVNCSKGLNKDFITTILDITRDQNSIANAKPSRSLYSSQEDLSEADSEESKKPEISDLSKLKAEQKKTLDRAKALLSAAFSEEEESDNEDDRIELIGGKDTDMP